MPLTKEEVFAYIKSLSSGELSQFITELQEELGVASTPQVYQPVTMGASLTMGEPIIEERLPGYHVYLLDLGPNRTHALKELRALTGISLAACKEIVDSLPQKIKEVFLEGEATQLIKALKEYGAIAEVRFAPTSPQK